MLRMWKENSGRSPDSHEPFKLHYPHHRVFLNFLDTKSAVSPGRAPELSPEACFPTTFYVFESWRVILEGGGL